MLPVSVKTAIPFTPLLGQIDTLTGLRDAAGNDALRASFDRAITTLTDQAEAGPQPEFMLAVASLLERSAFRRELRRHGATYPGDAQLYKALRDDLTTVNPYNLGQLLEIVDAVEAGADGEADPDALTGLEEISRIARSLGGAFAALEGDRDFFLNVAPLIACHMFLVGWSGVTGVDGTDIPFQRRGGRVPFDVLELVDEDDLRAAGFKIMTLMRPSKVQLGNSASPSRSRSGPRRTRKTGTKRLTAPNGPSSDSGTGETPAAS